MSGDTGRQSSSEVAHEAEGTRAHLASTLEQLRNNLRPENVIDEVVSNARQGASAVADNLVGLTRAYPLPSILIATGAALIMGVAGKGFGRSRKGADHLPRATTLRSSTTWPEPESGRVANLAGSASSMKQGVMDSLASGGSRASDAAAGLQQQASDVYETTSSSARDAMQNVTRHLPHSAGEAKSKLSNLLDEQPLILGAIGLAIGAAIGAAIPMSRTEDEWMGGTAHSVRQAAQDAAHHEVEGLRAVASDAIDNVKKSATDHGLSTDNLSDFVRDLGTQGKAAVDQVGGSLDAGKSRS